MNPLLKVALAAAKEAGDAIMALYTDTEFETKADGSPVTLADTRSNEILLASLSKTGIPILSEESLGIPVPYPSQLWIIDPLDGTKDFIKKSDDFSVMIGLLENGEPTLGVVYAPAHNTLYYAEKGAGAYVVRESVTTRLKVSNKETSPLRFVRSVNNFSDTMAKVAEKLSATLFPRGSVGVKAGVLGEAEGEFFFSQGKFGEWDVCAPEIITREAGGMVTDCEGNPLFYGTNDHRVERGIVFSNGVCHEDVLNAIKAVVSEGTV